MNSPNGQTPPDWYSKLIAEVTAEVLRRLAAARVITPTEEDET